MRRCETDKLQAVILACASETSCCVRIPYIFSKTAPGKEQRIIILSKPLLSFQFKYFCLHKKVRIWIISFSLNIPILLLLLLVTAAVTTYFCIRSIKQVLSYLILSYLFSQPPSSSLSSPSILSSSRFPYLLLSTFGSQALWKQSCIISKFSLKVTTVKLSSFFVRKI